MIHVERANVSEPPELRVLRKRHVFSPAAVLTGFRVDPGLTAEPIRQALLTLFREKCAFCETHVSTGEANVAHYRPAEGALDADGTYSPLHYQWLAYDWSNLYLACNECMRFKGHRFPVEGPRAPLGADSAGMAKEIPLLLDPCGPEEPGKHLIFGDDGTVVSVTQQGRATIDILSLNRARLVASRRSRVKSIRAVFGATVETLLNREATEADKQSVRKELEEAVAANRSYTALRRQISSAWVSRMGTKIVNLDVLPEILRPFARDRSIPKPDVTNIRIAFDKYEQKLQSYSVAQTAGYYSKARYIEKIQIENFRMVQDLELDFIASETDRAHWMMILGENGSGKSTVLQAIALTLMDANYRHKLALNPARQIRRSLSRRAKQPSSARISIFLSGSPIPIELTITRRGFHTSDPQPKALLLGYGATRLLPRPGERPERGSKFARVGNLFNPFLPLGRANEWFLKQDRAHFNAASTVVRLLLGLGDDAKLRRRAGTLLIDDGEVRSALHQLSDGYQSILALATDIMQVMFAKWEDMKVAEGVVLLDEIESHLHPKWKMSIVKQLRTCFPRIQFITTTHDPLCLRGLENGEIVVMRRDRRRGVFLETNPPDVKGLPIDQMLTSDLFALNTTLDPEVEETFRQYYVLLAKPNPTNREIARRAELQKIIESKRMLGTNQRERIMLEATDQYLAEARLFPSVKPAFQEIKNQIAKLWKEGTA